MSTQEQPAEQIPLSFDDVLGADEPGEGSDPACAGGDGDPSDQSEDEREMRVVKSRWQSRGGSRNYAKMGAASLAARIAFVMGGNRVHPDLEVEVRVVDERDTQSRHALRKTSRKYATCTSATPTVVTWAKEIDTHADGRPAREVAFLWGLSEWYQGNHVQARRLFAAAGEPKWSRHALSDWDARKLRTFCREIRFPSYSYESFDEYGEAQGAFYFGTRWREAQPRSSRVPLWP